MPAALAGAVQLRVFHEVHAAARDYFIRNHPSPLESRVAIKACIRESMLPLLECLTAALKTVLI